MIKDISKLANKYCLKVFSQENQEIGTLIDKMVILVNNGSLTINKLLTFPRYQKSQGLIALNKILSQIPDKLKQISTGGSYNGISEILNAAQFYTSPANAGTGYDPATRAVESGLAAPGFYVDQLLELNSKLETMLKKTR